ncbi:MAG: hypothetical protein MRY83_22910 [Flavobacteriales bacterium]|nr:hypothetical protein [Flavobacteriales bacterium]
MGRQIGISLSPEDEKRLIEFLKGQYPIKVVNHLYDKHWDKQTLIKTENAKKWLIIDTRVEDLIKKDSSNQIDSPGHFDHEMWQIRSWNRSCIEWNRKDLINDRLWIDTHENTPYGNKIPEEIRKDNLKYFNAACRWIKRNCVNTSNTRFALWESKNINPSK